MPIEHIRLSRAARDQLVTLKRRTKIMHWNVLCRWAFCRPLAEDTPPPAARAPRRQQRGDDLEGVRRRRRRRVCGPCSVSAATRTDCRWTRRPWRPSSGCTCTAESAT